MWAHGFVCVPCFVLERGVRILALMSWGPVSCRASDTHAPCSVSLCEHAVSSSLFCPCVLCFVLLHAVHIWSDACIHVMSCAVWHAACVFHWLRAFMLSCLVWTRGLWVFSLAACSCPVLHMAGDLFFVFFEGDITFFEDLSSRGHITKLKSPPGINEWEWRSGIHDRKEVIKVASS